MPLENNLSVFCLFDPLCKLHADKTKYLKICYNESMTTQHMLYCSIAE